MDDYILICFQSIHLPARCITCPYSYCHKKISFLYTFIAETLIWYTVEDSIKVCIVIPLASDILPVTNRIVSFLNFKLNCNTIRKLPKTRIALHRKCRPMTLERFQSTRCARRGSSIDEQTFFRSDLLENDVRDVSVYGGLWQVLKNSA